MSAKYKVGVDTGDSAVPLVATAVMPILREAPIAWPTGSTGDEFAQTVVMGYRTLDELKDYFQGGTSDEFVSTVAITTPSALSATQFTGFASTVSGATIMGFGTTWDVGLKQRDGTTVAGVVANSNTFGFIGRVQSTTALATPSAMAATEGDFFASTVSGATLMGFGTTGDVTLKNRAGTDVLFIGPNTTDVTIAGPLTITGTTAAAAGTVRYIGPSGSATDIAYNVPTGGGHKFRANGVTQVTIGLSQLSYGVAGTGFGFAGPTSAGADTASSATTFKASIGTGAGAVGGIVFQVPVTHGSDSVAQTLTTVLTLGATTAVTATFAGAVTVNAATQLGTSAGTDVTTIGGTGYGAGVASLRLNGLTTAAVTNQTGTLLNAPVAGNPTFWFPLSIAGVVKYVPAW